MNKDTKVVLPDPGSAIKICIYDESPQHFFIASHMEQQGLQERYKIVETLTEKLHPGTELDHYDFHIVMVILNSPLTHQFQTQIKTISTFILTLKKLLGASPIYFLLHPDWHDPKLSEIKTTTDIGFGAKPSDFPEIIRQLDLCATFLERKKNHPTITPHQYLQPDTGRKITATHIKALTLPLLKKQGGT